MANPRKGKGQAPPHEEALLTEARLWAGYFALLKMLAIETAQRDHDAAQDTPQTRAN